jgi:predicted TIM-barrel fold metal-dependent hydrolase
MILYSVTVNIDNEVHDEWLHWMKTEHIPKVLSTGLFVDNKILRMLDEVENGGVTYSFQYYLNNTEDFQTYQQHHAARLQAEHARRYQDRFVAFRTLLEVVS